MISRNGIYYDFSISPYKYKVGITTYVFSSKLHRIKFIDKLEENRKSINHSLTKRFNFPVEVNTLADMVLYRKIEKRGFLVFYGDSEICQNNLQFVGDTKTLMNSND